MDDAYQHAPMIIYVKGLQTHLTSLMTDDVKTVVCNAFQSGHQ